MERTGAPEGTKEERVAGAWGETIEWDWKFKGEDAWLAVNFDKGKHFTKGELRYTPRKDEKTPAIHAHAHRPGQVHRDLCRHAERTRC